MDDGHEGNLTYAVNLLDKNWGQINWGQININFQSVRAEGKGGFLILEYQKSFSPPCLQPSLIDQINVDLTPIDYAN
jgi:hypothetical protein